MLNNVNTLRILILKLLCNRSKFLSYIFKYFVVKNIHCIDINYSVSEFVYKFFFFLAIPDNSLFSVLNGFFLDNDTY